MLKEMKKDELLCVDGGSLNGLAKDLAVIAGVATGGPLGGVMVAGAWELADWACQNAPSSRGTTTRYRNYY